MNNDCILQVHNISKHFGGIAALENVRFDLRQGEVHALVGANGAGKSTLIKILTGAHLPDQGEITLNSQTVHIHSPWDARVLGISAVYQEFSLNKSLSVAENIYMGKLPTHHGFMVNWKEVYDNAERVLAQMESHISPQTLVKDLSVAQKQLVEIAKALSNQSKILIMDEPTASLTDNDIEHLFRVVKGLAKQGISVIYVSHRLEELPVIADRVTVFRDGQYVITLDIQDAPKSVIIQHMVGKGLEHTPKTQKSSGDVLLEVKHFRSGKAFQDVSFTLHKGEILGLAGLAGAGRTELARAIFGADPKEAGEIRMHGQPIEIRSPRDAKRHGIGFVTEDRKEEGLVLGLDLLSNISMTILDRLTHYFVLRNSEARAITEQFIRTLQIKTSGPTQIAKNLSGGNQQKVVVSKWLATKPTVLIMDEPTRGIDVGSKGQIYSLLNKLADAGLGILMISSEIPEILEMSDRILVMSGGEITAELPHHEATQDAILHYATLKTVL
ncbi:putative ribose/galactose/methyl galactoside import ATP-binding protein [Candidatus Vecturithrix granuli]|uniref:Putative ribose/galactose/methyl galactoside import ATP-binding protein n=1 Tax=Vecturithrix granuli TaxID=1499967 RepID=A0A081C316_VECG1|nr:putative ribose/galactose/methyl galactoside import ATP-binding protein [Candidatus Vecturithrix granuli]